MKIRKILFVASLFMFNCYEVIADDAATVDEEVVGDVTTTKGIFEDLGFGIGLSFTLDTGSNDRVKAAEVVNGTVRVTDQENGIPRLVLEMHNFYWDKGRWGHGPFVAVQAGEDEIVNAVAVGWMAGLKYNNNEENNRSFNFGVGLAADPNVQILGDGISENSPLPEGETTVRFKEETQYGIMFLFSTSW